MTREEAKEAIKEAYGNSEYTDEIIKALEQEPKTGHWIWCVGAYKCSNCEKYACFNDKELARYCPNCGAKMIEPLETEVWNGIHGQITAPKGTFERIFNDADDDNDI